jgi:hypothetical protein
MEWSVDKSIFSLQSHQLRAVVNPREPTQSLALGRSMAGDQALARWINDALANAAEWPPH